MHISGDGMSNVEIRMTTRGNLDAPSSSAAGIEGAISQAVGTNDYEIGISAPGELVHSVRAMRRSVLQVFLNSMVMDFIEGSTKATEAEYEGTIWSAKEFVRIPLRVTRNQSPTEGYVR